MSIRAGDARRLRLERHLKANQALVIHQPCLKCRLPYHRLCSTHFHVSFIIAFKHLCSLFFQRRAIWQDTIHIDISEPFTLISIFQTACGRSRHTDTLQIHNPLRRRGHVLVLQKLLTCQFRPTLPKFWSIPLQLSLQPGSAAARTAATDHIRMIVDLMTSAQYLSYNIISPADRARSTCGTGW